MTVLQYARVSLLSAFRFPFPPGVLASRSCRIRPWPAVFRSRSGSLNLLSAGIPLWLVYLAFVVPLSAQSLRIDGIVRDPSGAPIAGAKVILQIGAEQHTVVADSEGRFSFEDLPLQSGKLLVSAKDFASVARDFNFAGGQPIHFEIVLPFATKEERVVVTATRIESRLGDVADSEVALDSADLIATPALTVDDKLRQIPGFSLFRRSGSRTANPTTLGVSLSGLGSSGASRALVLEDGVPLNDPFGGWIYWDRIPQQSLDGVELVRRGESSLYGGDALSGAIQFFTRQPLGPDLSLEVSYGSENTPDLSLWTGTRIGPWDFSLAADLFHTDGYILVPASIRGPVDTRADSQDAVLDFTVGHRLGEKGRIFGRTSYFTEDRDNGSRIQTNDTQLGTGVVGVDTPLGTAGSISARAYGSTQSYSQNFSAIAASRMTESLTDQQHVPSQQGGGSLFWSRAAGSRQTLGLGASADEVMGSSHENFFSSGTHTAFQTSGGRQRSVAAYGEDILRITARFTATASFRFDDVRNFDAATVRTPLAPPGPPVTTPFADRTDTAFSPRLSLLYAANKSVSLTASGYRSFRNPTLNELYRSFRMGDVLTEANAGLVPERLTGAEAGANVRTFSEKLILRGNFFWSDVTDPIESVTLATTPTLITEQRENLGRTRSRGVELDAESRLNKHLEISGGYQYVAATVVSYPANAALVGLDVPEVPRNQFTVQARYWHPSSFVLSVEGRFVGRQYDDSLNQFLLPRYFALDLLVARSLGRGVEAFAAFENLFDQRYYVELTPTPMLGPPIQARVGLRYRRSRDARPA